jgi:clan AA aspartic protease (TIGR02281 family)
MRKTIIALLSLTTLTASGFAVSGDKIFKCKNQSGDLLYQKYPCKENVQTISSWTAVNKVKPITPEPEKINDTEFTVRQSSAGHYFLPGTINDKALTFVIDTGASYVSLPSSVAHEAQIYCKDRFDMESANGVTNVCSTTIQKLNFGPFQVKDIKAVIVPNLNQPLLGMNVLQQLTITQDRGEMHLSTRQ